MEVYEHSITPEESRNYHHFYYELQQLNLRDWIKAYIFTVCFVSVICLTAKSIAPYIFMIFWYMSSTLEKSAMFTGTYAVILAHFSRSIQLNAMMDKYLKEHINEDVLTGKVQFKKIKITNTRIKMYYIKNDLNNISYYC